MATFTEVKMYKGEVVAGLMTEKELVCTHYITGTKRAQSIFDNKFGRRFYFRKGDKVISYQVYTMRPVEMDTKPKTEFY